MKRFILLYDHIHGIYMRPMWKSHQLLLITQCIIYAKAVEVTVRASSGDPDLERIVLYIWVRSLLLIHNLL